MDTKEKDSKKKNKERKLSNQIDKKDSKFYIYCFTSFHSDVYKDNKFNLISKNEEVISVKILSKNTLPAYSNYSFIIYEFCLNKAIKELNLALKNITKELTYDLNKIKIKSEKEKVIIIDDIEVNQDSLFDLLTQLDHKFLEKYVFIIKYLNRGEKLDLFLNCFEKMENKDELKRLLASQFLSGLKEGNEVVLSELICILNISFGTKIITKFLDIYPKLDIQFDTVLENKEFDNNILNLYKSNINQFFEKNNKFFQKVQVSKNNKINENKEGISSIEKYNCLLEDFIIIYLIIYDDPIKIEKQKLIKARKIFINLIENKNDFIKVIKFLLYKFETIYTLLTIDNSERFIVKPITNHLAQLVFDNFCEYYEMIKNEEINKNRFIYDFSEIFNFFVDHIKNLKQLVSLKNLYSDELDVIPNNYFKEKIRILIHTIGYNSSKIGIFDNKQILFYLRKDDVYSKNDVSNTDLKDFEILKYLKIELMDEQFFEEYKRYEIYTFFEENYLKYLKTFSAIKEIKYFGHFFKLLPPEKYQKDTANFVLNWLGRNISTYDQEECPDFINNLEIFYSILNEKTKYQLLLNLLNILKSNLGDDCIKIFISLINKFGDSLNQKEAEIMVKYILYEQQDEKEEKEEEMQIIKLNNVYTFLEDVKPSKLIIKIFLNNIANSAITEDDFFLETSFKFSLFDMLLEMENYSLLEKPDNKNYQYWLNTKRICVIIHDNLKNFNFTFFKIKYFIKNVGEKDIIKRIASIAKCLNIDDYKKNSKLIYSQIKGIYEKWENNIKIIEKIKEFYIFAYEKNKIIEEMSKYNMKIKNSTLQYLNSKEANDEYSKFSKDISNADKVSKLRQCAIFVDIFNDTKRRFSLKNYIEETEKRFNNIKNIFINDKDKIEVELKNNEEAKFLINVAYKNENCLEKEVDWLLNYFKITDFVFKDLLIDYIKLIVKKKSIFSIISGIIKLFDIYKDTLNLINQEDKSLYDEMIKYKNLLTINKDIAIEEIQKIDNNLENKFNINEKTSKIFLKLLIAIDQYPESIKFIKDKKFEEVCNLVQFLLESDNTPLSEKDINDFINIVKLFEEINSSLKGQYDIFIKFICKILIQITEDKTLGNSLFNYIEKYNHIQTLFNDYLKHSEGCIKKIEKILEESNFNISKEDLNLDNVSYTIQGTFNDQSKDYKIKTIEQNEGDEISKYKTKKYQPIFYHDLEFLFQRVFISKVPQKYEASADLYIKFFKNVKKLINLFNAFYAKGFQETFEINIDFKEKKLICTYLNKQMDIDILIMNFQLLNFQLDKILNKIYHDHEIMRFFYGRQISYIYTNMINKNNKRILDLLRASFNPLFGDCVLDNFDFDLKEKNIVKKYCENISFINNYIKRQFSFNQKNVENIFEENKINIKLFNLEIASGKGKKNKNDSDIYKGIYFYSTNKNQELEILNLYVIMTQHFPINGTFLYCTKDITFEEIQCFFLRFIHCKENVLFSAVNFNLLSNEIREQFISLLTKYYLKYESKLRSCLIIVFNDNEEELQKILKKKNIKKFPNINFFQCEYKFSDYFNYNDFVVKSTSCGLGKSEFIKNKNKEMNGKKNKHEINYIYFPIGGKFKRKNLVDRLLNLPDMTNLKEKFSIHFDLSQTKEIELLNEFFFKLIILRKVELNESAKYFGSNVDIMIEVPNDYSDYINDIEILSKLKTEKLESITNIKSTPELLNVVKVMNIFESDEIIKNKKINLKKINLKLTPEQLSDVVLEYLGDIQIKNPNFYQINIFIKILSDEFIKFVNCNGYSVDTLYRNGLAAGLTKEKARKLAYLRKFIINSLVQVTKLFLVGPYENLLKNQEINNELYNKTEDDKEDLINTELDININSVSFDEIKPSLIVFNEDGQSCTIITTCSEKDPEFKDLENLYNSQNIEFLSNKVRSRSLKNIPIAKKNENNIENKTENKFDYKRLKTFRNLSRKEILDNLFNFLNITGLSEEQKNKILGNYVYTPDNFIKVVLILLRVRVGIPVILMGETGCGKTTLIEMASKLINKGKILIHKMNIHAGINDEDIIKFMKNVKENVDAEDKRMFKAKKAEFEALSEKDKKLYLKKNSMEKILLEYETQVKNRKIWIFFDEINTCYSMGLFTEILCKNTIYGKPLDERFVFIAACNPYRVSKKGNKLLSVLYKKNFKRKNLVYTVNPLPISLLNFVFNFGSLKEKDELTYIKSMVEGVTSEIFDKIKDINLLGEKFEFIKKETECVQICQNYMKKKNDVSIVSLREVNRFNIFVQFFFEYLLNRKKYYNILEDNDIINFYNSKNEIEILLYAVNLSLFICYYLRTPDKKSREELCSLLNEKKYFSEGDFLKIPQMEENYLLDNFEVPIGIAKNKNLKENIFLIFFCIINRIPLIICGKPGKSKTLSFEIVQESMKGLSSKSSFCRKYPPLIPFKIQGSLNTTSEEILNVFNKGRKYQKKNEDKLAVVFMDEMGLAEIGENNPLKVMHAELEQEEDKVSFVGISNWFIDASKMNRVIYNVVQDDDEEDLIHTGKEIAKSYEKIEDNFNSDKYSNLIMKLSKAYYKFITNKQENKDKNQYFHGSRDFYSLIKSIMRDIIKNKKIFEKYDIEGDEDKSEKLLNEICINHIFRNFGGLQKSVSEFLEVYEDKSYLPSDNTNYNFMKCISDNINDIESRYLLLINEGHLSQELLNYILEDIKGNRNKITINKGKYNEKGIEIFDGDISEKKEIFIKYYIGSKFKSDKNNVVYSNEILNKIRTQMETENILILKDLESVYPALYELFNQNYIYLNGKKFVHLGESKSLSLVNDKFKVIVLVENDQIENQEPPFLNRFEKHIINFSSLLNYELQELANDIFNTLNEMFIIKNRNETFGKDNKDNDKIIGERLKKYNNFVTEKEIQGLVYIGSKQLNYSNIQNEETKKTYKSLIIKFVIERICPCFTEELMVLITKFGFKQKYNSYYKLIYQCYKESYCNNFENYLIKSKSDMSIVYTFSEMFDEIKINSSELKNYVIKQVNMNNVNSIEEINKKIIDFIFVENNNGEINYNQQLLIIKFKEEDMYKLNNIYYLIDDYKSNSRNKRMKNTRKIVFIVYLKKLIKIKNYISFLSNCPQIMINDLNNTFENFPEILTNSNKNIINKESLFDIDKMVLDNINNILLYFNYILFNFEDEQSNSYRKKIVRSLTYSSYLKNIIKSCLANLANNENNEEDFLVKICKEEEIQIRGKGKNKGNIESSENYNFSFLLDSHINSFIVDNLRIIIIILEKEQIMNAIISSERLCTIDLIKNYINDFVENINTEENKKYRWKNKNLNKKVDIIVLNEQKFPFCQKIFNNLFSFVKNNISIKFLEKDTYFITTNIKEQYLRNELEEYKKFMQKMDDILKFEIFKDKKNKIVYDILNSNNEELISNLFEDVFFAFIKKNDKLKKNYSNLSQILNLLIQLRLKTRINGELNLLFVEKDEIKIYNSFLDLIKEEYILDEKDEKEESIYMNEMKINKNSIYFNVFISIVNFLQSYSNEIYIILELYYFLLESIPSIYDDVVSMIRNKKISMEESKRNSYYNKINKFCFFYILESLCRILNEKIYEMLDIKRDVNEKISYFKSVQYLVQNILQLEKRFLLFSKEIFSLDIIIKIISQIQLKDKDHSFLYLSIESLKIFLSKTDKNKLIENLQGKNMMLIKIFGNNIDEYSQLMNKILLNSYKSEYDENIREKIIKEIILEDKLEYHKELMEYSYPLMKLIFKFNSLELPLKKEHKNKFFDNFNDKNPIKKCINDKNDKKIDELLFYRFEILFQKYFKNILIQNKDNEELYYQKLCGDLSKLYLIDAIDCFYKKTNLTKINLNNIYKLYCIAYIKVYLNYYVDMLFEKEKYSLFNEREEINNILFSTDIKQKNVVRFYVLKLLSKKFKNWEDFVKYYYSINEEKNDIYGFNKTGNILKIEKSDYFIKSPILLHCNKIRENYEYSNFISKMEIDGLNKYLFENMFLKVKRFNYLYIFLTNASILLNSYDNKDEIKQKKDKLINLISVSINYLNEEKKHLDKDILLFINTFFDIKKLNETIIPKLGISKEETRLSKIIVLYYSLFFVISIIIISQKSKTKSSNSDNFYQNLISKNISIFLDSNYIPGNFQMINLRIKSFYQIKEILKKDPLKYGAYICSCGYHYTIDKCTFPTREYKCPICSNKIGGKNRNLVKREGHIRIFLDEETRTEKLNKLKKYPEKKYLPNILLDEFEKEINEKKNEMNKGIKTNGYLKEDFLFIDENVRDMKDITYRFLNFVLYSFIFYANIMGFIKEKNINKYNIENMTCFNIIEKDWEIMGKLLGKIPVELFINLIYDDIIEKLLSCPIFNSKEEAIKFEKEVNEIIINKLKETKLINNLKQINDNAINLDFLSNKAIIQEKFTYQKYLEKDFPDFKYFYIFEFPTEEHFIKSFNSNNKNKDKYPIINCIINNDSIYSKIELMKYIPKINKLCNYMINFVSFKYSREEAKSILVKDEIKEEDFTNTLQEFIQIYKKIRPYIKQQGCHEFGKLFLEMKEESILLSDLCVDSGEMGFGLVLYAIYEEMIGWQNNFINEVINSENIQIKNYKDLFNSKIMIQDCENDQILNLPKFDSEITLRNDKDATLFEMIVDNSHRKESEVIYNFEEIEEELASFILPKIKGFKPEIRKVIYQYECLIGERSSLIINFRDKYQLKELTEIELNAIVCYILKNKNNNKFDKKKFLFSLQFLIATILDESPSMSETLLSILEKPENNNIPFFDIDINFFNGVLENIKQFETLEENNENKNKGNNSNYLTVNCLINLIELVELFCWNDIRNNLDNKYLEDINESIKLQFDLILNLKHDDENNTLIVSKLELCSAIRKFLSRYSSGKSDENINSKNLLKNYIINEELWPINLAELNLDTEINMIFGNLDVKISQAVKLYDYLGGEGEKLEEIKNKYNKFAEKNKQLKQNLKIENVNNNKEKDEKINNLNEIIREERKSNISLDNNDVELGNDIAEEEEEKSEDSNEENNEEEEEKNEEVGY